MDSFRNVVVKKELKVECAELIQGICLDVLAIKLKDPSIYFRLLKICNKLIKVVGNNMNIGMTECRLQMAKLVHKCDAEMTRTSPRPRGEKEEE